jgi:nucleoside-triphosphatase THEP1
MLQHGSKMSTRPIPAVGLASALVQIIEFGINVLRKDHPIHQPTNESATTVENAAVLQNIIDTFYRLTDLIAQSELKKLHDEKSEQKKSAKLSEAAQQLLKHSDQVKELVESLRDALISAQARGSVGDARWPTARDALMNGVWKKKDVTGHKKKFRALRREIDTSLLLALRQYLDQSAETGLPVFAEDGQDGKLRHWEKWQNEALDSIHANQWKPNKKKNVEEFSKIVNKLIVLENEAHFRDSIFRLLWFEQLDDRLHSIERPMDGTMNWVFGDERMQEEGALLDWLGSTSGQNLFWITGKPGCGKTILTKHLFRNAQIFDYLEAWSGASPGITAAYFFWNSGSEVQNSAVGLFRSILYESLQDMIFGPLEQDQGIIQWLFADRWGQFTSYGGGLHGFALPELRKAFDLMISDVSKKFLFMVDGLDEMDTYSEELVSMLTESTKKENVKIIVSSRRSPTLDMAFENRPHLVLDEWTKKDSGAHVLHTFSQNEILTQLRSKADNVEEMNVINTLAEKADGVFLWAALATSLILQGTKEDDDFTTLRSRAEALPSTLDLLVPNIVESLETADAGQFWKIATLLESHSCPGLLPLSFALTSDTKATIAADVKPLKSAETTKRVEEMRDLVQHKCRNLFSFFDISPPDQTESRGRAEYLKVTYNHRMIRDHLPSRSACNGTRTSSSFDPTTQWANAHLWTLKTLRPSSTSDLSIWPALSACLESSLLLHAQTSKLPLSYLDAAAETALQHHRKSPTTSDLPSFPSIPATTLESFLDLAVLLNLQGYVTIKAKTAEKKEVRHAIDFNREVRKRLGVGGEAKWLGGGGGEELERLREEGARERMEVDGLLLYYAKNVRFGSAKPHVEVPEYV